MIRICLFLLFCFLSSKTFCQYSWKLEKDKDGIKVYSSQSADSKFKAIKVACTLKGNYNKLITILSDVIHNSEWVYNSKATTMLKQNNPLDFIYYTETNLPWPLSNRDAVIHIRINTDSLPKLLTISGTGEPKYTPEKSGKVRVPHYLANWRVTMPSAQTLQVMYVVEVNPGGSISAWIANMFVNKGPYESFKKLAEKLAK